MGASFFGAPKSNPTMTEPVPLGIPIQADPRIRVVPETAFMSGIVGCQPWSNRRVRLSGATDPDWDPKADRKRTGRG